MTEENLTGNATFDKRVAALSQALDDVIKPVFDADPRRDYDARMQTIHDRWNEIKEEVAQGEDPNRKWQEIIAVTYVKLGLASKHTNEEEKELRGQLQQAIDAINEKYVEKPSPEIVITEKKANEIKQASKEKNVEEPNTQTALDMLGPKIKAQLVGYVTGKFEALAEHAELKQGVDEHQQVKAIDRIADYIATYALSRQHNPQKLIDKANRKLGQIFERIDEDSNSKFLSSLKAPADQIAALVDKKHENNGPSNAR